MSQDPKWVEIAVKILKPLGFSEVRLRWRIQKYLESKDSDGGSHTAPARKFNKCYHCRSLQSPGDKICDQCGKSIAPNLVEKTKDTFTSWEESLNAPMVLMLLFVLAYLRVWATQSSGASPWSLSGQSLSMHGAVSRSAVYAYGQWWRLGSAAFLHSGLMHIGFNIYALMIIAPKVEEICGRGRTLLLFMVCAIFGFFATITFSNGGSVGASGGIMGFLGFAAAWGHKDGTPHGIEVRNMMVQWFIFVTIFGLLMNTDHAAHFGGFISGAFLGWVVTPSGQMKVKQERLTNTLSFLVFIPLALISLGQIFAPETTWGILSGFYFRS